MTCERCSPSPEQPSALPAIDSSSTSVEPITTPIPSPTPITEEKTEPAPAPADCDGCSQPDCNPGTPEDSNLTVPTEAITSPTTTNPIATPQTTPGPASPPFRDCQASSCNFGTPAATESLWHDSSPVAEQKKPECPPTSTCSDWRCSRQNTPESALAYRGGGRDGGNLPGTDSFVTPESASYSLCSLCDFDKTDSDVNSYQDDEEGEEENHESSDEDDSPYLFTPDPPEVGAQQPFAKFQKQVPVLIRDLNLGHTGSAQIEDLGGRSHRILGIRYPKRQHGKSKGQQYQLPMILRIPRKSKMWTTCEGVNKNIQHEVAVLNFLRQLPLASNIIPTPIWFAYDCTPNNEMRLPYILVEWYEDVLRNCDKWKTKLKTRFELCEQLVDLLTAQEQIRFPEAGKLVSAWDLPTTYVMSPMQNFSSDEDPPTSVKLVGLGSGVRVPTQKNLKGIFQSLIKGWPLRESKWFLTSYDHIWDKLRVVAEEMDGLRFFDQFGDYVGPFSTDLPERMVLWHGDLEPRNLAFHWGPAIESTNSEQLYISGMTKWDDVLALPPVLARRPPMWLWKPNIEEEMGEEWDGDVDALPDRPTLSAEDIRVRDMFILRIEQTLPGYTKDAFGPRGRWLRRFFEIIRHGFLLTKHVKRAGKFLEDWEEYKEEFWPIGLPKSETPFWRDLSDEHEQAELAKLENMQLF
ncbi:hypothetical protein FN846DRAFT_398294 [Sphaerosporella brunnea]|uniref:Uncharacterized protein n=1 Tax=Sphaerosporella brunnea TaxID=1250544 RepID=A0A5J5EG22_9PEZI|nr:hypothetical protein FN846DRAFT_922804 [Sphaerosporella brunnea]KAA8894670.1 hypothetical protein FN846DRAFT_398294 [Sphaerosporella brunnea]